MQHDAGVQKRKNSNENKIFPETGGNRSCAIESDNAE